MRTRGLSVLIIPLTWAILAAAPGGCRRALPPAGAGAASKAEPPAKVERPLPESELAVVRLTAQAEERLQIKTAPAEERELRRRRAWGAEARALPGLSVTVAAPLAGTLALPPGAKPPRAGGEASPGPVFLLAPLLTPESRVALAGSRAAAEGALEKARVELDAARVSLTRSEQLLADRAGNARSVDEARARLLAAEAALRAAEAGSEVLRRALDAAGGSASPIEVAAPFGGVFLSIRAAPGQTVAAGEPLFEIASIERLWIRVPVHGADLDSIDQEADARLAPLGAAPGSAAEVPGRRVAGPPTADPLSATVDLYYEVESSGRTLRPGQRVSAALPLSGSQKSLVVPWSSVLIDIHGGAWVYEKLAAGRYTRRRVEVRRRDADWAELASGPRPGSSVVTDGAAELFGTEFGIGK